MAFTAAAHLRLSALASRLLLKSPSSSSSYPKLLERSNQRWGFTPFHYRVFNIPTKNYTQLLMKHHVEEQQSKAKTNTDGALLPHEILASVYTSNRCQQNTQESALEMAELQWRRTVDDLTHVAKLKNCIAVCDGSMQGTAMDVCVALAILLSELSEHPWKGRVITFTRDPHILKIEGKTLKEKAEFVDNMRWYMNTDFKKVFDRLLKLAVNGELKEKQMIRRVVVFSKKEFNEASRRNWEADYEEICKKFRGKGYGSCIPAFVFWNLMDEKSTSVLGKQKGVTMLNGFSRNLIQLFLKGEEGTFTPESVTEKAISGEEYDKLLVTDS